jgi:transposase
MADERRKFDAEFRAGAVRIVTETGKPITQVAKDLGINETTLASWVSRARMAGRAETAGESEELARLRRENAQLKKVCVRAEPERAHGRGHESSLWEDQPCAVILTSSQVDIHMSAADKHGNQGRVPPNSCCHVTHEDSVAGNRSDMTVLVSPPCRFGARAQRESSTKIFSQISPKKPREALRAPIQQVDQGPDLHLRSRGGGI